MVAPLHAPRAKPTPKAANRTAEGFKKRRPYRSDQTVGAMLLALLVAMLLGSQSLVELASQQPYGTKRTVVLALANSVDRVAHALSLDRPARAFNEWTGDTPPVRIDVEEVVQQQAVSPPTTLPAIPLEVNPTTGLRYVSSTAPLRVLLAGDSMMRELGSSIENLAPGELTDTSLDYRVSSGLTRPDFFDWPSHLAVQLDQAQPEALVLMFGANDHQNVEVDGKILTVDTPEWFAEYHRRVGLVMDLLHRPGLTVTWVAQPAMRATDFSAAMAALSEVYRSEAQSRPWVHVVELSGVLNGPDGGYAASLPGEDGAPVVMRQEDGVHLSRAGADRAAVAVWDDVVQRWDLEQAAADEKLLD